MFPRAIGREEIDADFRKIIGHSVKHAGLYIPDHRLSVDSAYRTSKSASGGLVDYILGGSALNHVGHRECVPKSSAGAIKERKHVEFVGTR